MATSLLSNASSTYQLQTNILTNRPGTIKVIVEDEFDVYFWHNLLTRCCPDKRFDISPYHTGADKGKAQILAMSANFGPYMIGCVDSDHDYLLENHTQDGTIIKNNRYIIQTYAYSLENLACQPYGLSDKILECSLHSCDFQIDADRDYHAFILKTSELLYPVLLWILTLDKAQIPHFSITDEWNKVLNNDLYRSIITDKTLPLPQKRTAILAELSSRSDAAVAAYQQNYPTLINDVASLETDLTTNYALTPTSAYLYVRGHNLYDFIHFTFFDPLEDYLCDQHTNLIKAQLPEAHRQNALSHYRKIRKTFEKDHIHICGFLEDSQNPTTVLLKNAVTASGI